jgi:hypothetical protein
VGAATAVGEKAEAARKVAVQKAAMTRMEMLE